MNSRPLPVQLLLSPSLFLLAVAAACSSSAWEEPPARAEPEAEAEAGELKWHDSYAQAYRAAAEQKKMLLVNFVPEGKSAAQQRLDSYLAGQAEVRQQLQDYVLVKVGVGQVVETEDGEAPLLRHPAFAGLHGQAGLGIIDLQSTGRSYSGRLVSAFPFRSGKYYRWSASHLPTILSLPPGTLTQRSMVWAVRTHHERPASTDGPASEVLLTAASSHSQHQARIGNQGHHNFSSRSSQLSARMGTFGGVSEVVAESWPGQTMIDSCVDCVRSWRQSPGHWGEVRRRHRRWGYDIRRGRNGIWYATGIFAR